MTFMLPHVLDIHQARRIEFVHGGFLYQHLYAVGCLLLAEKAGVSAVVVERDEDIEILASTQRLYVQVKTRSAPIIPSDIEDVLKRFEILRAEHSQGHREGAAGFAIVVNMPPGPVLAARIKSGEIPKDVHILWPEHEKGDVPAVLPPSWRDISEAVQWCTAIAETLPFASLTPDSLVWKLAGRVLLAASGGAPHSDHTFQVEDLPTLFEQLLIQMQDFPEPPALYRPQTNEPSLDSGQRLRIVCGFSGAGKTAWASQAALHTSQKCAYFDVGDVPGPALAASLVRELAAQLVEKAPSELQRILLPGATGSESLRALDTYVGLHGLHPLIVLDNAHRVPADNLRSLVSVTKHLRFVLLCQPSPNVQELEVLLGLERESLLGWDIDTIAAEVAQAGGQGSAATYQRLKMLTAGLPLYVQSAARVAVNEYGGDLGQFCTELDTQTNIIETAQEIILARVFEALPVGTRDAVAILSLSDIGLGNAEVVELLNKSLELSAAATATIIRTLRPTGVVQVFGNQQLKIHDAVRVLGRRHFEAMGQPARRLAQVSLKDILYESLCTRRETSRFSLFIRMLVALGDVKSLVGLATEELFHEMGIGGEMWESLETAAVSADIDAEQRFWALDGLAFADLKAGNLENLPPRLRAMEQLLAESSLGNDEKLAFMMKRMLFQSYLGRADEVMASMAAAADSLPSSPGHQRIFRYNFANALWRLKRYADAEQITREVIDGYYEVIGITPDKILGRNPSDIWPLLSDTPTIHEDVKHLADSLELCALAVEKQGRDSGLLRIQAMKFYDMAGAIDSLIRVGQDLADEFIGRRDYIGARNVIEKNVLPNVIKHNMIDRIIAVRSQYAVILAYCEDFGAADAEMRRLAPYVNGFSLEQKLEIENQRVLIDRLRRGRQMYSRPFVQQKIGRNDPCPCGSGLKYKKCHGK